MLPGRQCNIGETDRGEGRQVELDRGEKVDLVERRLETREPLRGAVETVAIDVEQGQPIETRARAVEEEAGPHAGLEMVGGQIGSIELAKLLRGATPGETVGQAVNQHIVNREHEGRVDCMRSRDLIVARRLRPLHGPVRHALG